MYFYFGLGLILFDRKGTRIVEQIEVRIVFLTGLTVVAGEPHSTCAGVSVDHISACSAILTRT